MGVVARRLRPELPPATAPERPPVWPGTNLGRAVRLGVVLNPKSGHNQRRGRLEELRTTLGNAGVAYREAHTLDGLIESTRALLSDGTEVIAIHGGDGTVQGVLTGLLRADFDRPPPLLAVLPGGTTNTTARNVGYGAGPARALATLIAQARSGLLTGSVDHRAVVRVERMNDPAPLFAMFFGAGAVYHGIRLAKEQVESRGMRGQLGASVALAVFLAKIATGKGGKLFPPLGAKIAVDGGIPRDERLLGLLVSTMERQFLGILPYWGNGPGALRLTSLAAAPRHVVRCAIPVMRGKPNPLTTPENGYASCNADRVELELDSGFTLDGELFSAGPGGRLVLRGDHSVYFLRRQG